MTKTSIDGLRVREPSERRPAANSRTTSTHAVDMTTRRSNKSNTSASKRQAALDSMEKIRKRQAAASAFLDPVETFDFDAESTTQPDTSFSAGAEVDWSDLLDGFNETPTATPSRLALPASTTDIFDDWGEQPSTANSLVDDLINDEPESEPKISKAPEKKHRHSRHKKLHIGRIVAITVVCLLVIGGGIIYKWGDELISRLTGGNSWLWDALVSFVSDEVPFETDQNGRTNVLIFGTEGYNMNGDTAYGEHDGAQLTDSIMVASFDQNTKDVALISLPRDLKVSRACSAGKINEVFWCHNQDGANEDAGAKALMEQVGSVLGLDFQYYAHINWASLIDIINTLGGITVTLDEDINDYGWTNAVAQAGVPMQVNGEQALGLARARHGTTGGDFTRGNTQQKIVEGIVNKLMENGVGVTEALNLLGILGDNLRSNFSTDNIKAGVRMLSGFSINNIRQIPLVNYDDNIFYVTTATINDISYVVPAAGTNNYSEIQKYIASMLADDQAALEQARVAVYNASGQYGVASAERTRLQNDEYNVVAIGDAELGSCLEEYCVFAINPDLPATQTALEQRYGVMARDIAELPDGIATEGADFVIVLGFSGDAT